MKRTLKAILCIALSAVMLLSLSACGPKPTEENLEGVWKYTNGDYYLYFEIDEYKRHVFELYLRECAVKRNLCRSFFLIKHKHFSNVAKTLTGYNLLIR